MSNNTNLSNVVQNLANSTSSALGAGLVGYNGTTVYATLQSLEGLLNSGTVTTFTSTANQTVFTVNYTIGKVQVYLNGVWLSPSTDFTATNGTSITLTTALEAGVTVSVVPYEVVTVANAVTASDLASTNASLGASLIGYSSTGGTVAAALDALRSGSGGTGSTSVSRTVTSVSATTAGQTTFSVTYTPNLLNVYLNGTFLTPTTDYTATDGATVVLVSSVAANVVVGSLLTFEVFAAGVLYSLASPVVSTIAALRAILHTNSQNAVVTGYYTHGDGGGGTYYYDSADTTSVDNGGTIIVSTDGGRWKLVHTGTVSVKQFGAKGDGTTDDTAAIQNTATALINNTVSLPTGSFLITAAISVSGSTVLQGSGRKSTTIVPSGTFDAFTFSTVGAGSGMTGIGFKGTNHTGNSIVVNTADRTTFKDLLLDTSFNGFYISTSNVCTIQNVWMYGLRGTYGIQWNGTATARSDVLDLSNIEMSCTANTVGVTGVLLDGNVNTLSLRHVACVYMTRSLWARNTSGTTGNPTFITAYDFQSDFSQYEAVRLEGVRGAFFNDLYAHGSSLADGVYIDVNCDNIEFVGGQIDGHYLRGIYALGRYTRIGQGAISNNSIAGSALYPGIQIGPASIGVSVVGGISGMRTGYSTNLQSYGVQIDSGATNYNVSGVNLKGNVTSDYIDNAKDSGSAIFGNSQSNTSVNTVSGPIQSNSGNLSLNASSTNVVSLGNSTNGIGFAAQPSAALSVNYMKAYGNAAGYGPTLQAVGADTNISFHLKATGTGSVILDSNAVPVSDNTIALGSTSLRYSSMSSYGLKTVEGSNAKQGTATLASGTIVVANTSITATSRIFITAQDNNTTGSLRVSARTAGTSFTITSSNSADSGVVAYEIFEVG